MYAELHIKFREGDPGWQPADSHVVTVTVELATIPRRGEDINLFEYEYLIVTMISHEIGGYGPTIECECRDADDVPQGHLYLFDHYALEERQHAHAVITKMLLWRPAPDDFEEGDVIMKCPNCLRRRLFSDKDSSDREPCYFCNVLTVAEPVAP